jgi:hypothetical protein
MARLTVTGVPCAPFTARKNEHGNGRRVLPSSPTIRQATGIRDLRKKGCDTCGSSQAWESTEGAITCGVCHPPASPELVKRWVTLSGDKSASERIVGSAEESGDAPLVFENLEETVGEVFGSYGLEVLHVNPDRKQQGWSRLYHPISELDIARQYKLINTLRPRIGKNLFVGGSYCQGCSHYILYKQGKPSYDYSSPPECRECPKVERPGSRDLGLYGLSREERRRHFEMGLITRHAIYASFWDRVWRQNNQGIVVEKAGERRVIENLSGRWNKKRPWGYQVRKRLRGELIDVVNPVMVTLTVSRERVEQYMPSHTNFDPVSYAIWNIGEWISYFQNRLDKYQKKHDFPCEFIGWALQFQGEKGGKEEFNRGFPHIHMIYAGNWVGYMRDMQALWPYGGPNSVDIEDRKKFMKRHPNIPYTSIKVANYLTKYVSKTGGAIIDETGEYRSGQVHKGYAWLAFAGGRVFSIAHKSKQENADKEKV